MTKTKFYLIFLVIYQVLQLRNCGYINKKIRPIDSCKNRLMTFSAEGKFSYSYLEFLLRNGRWMGMKGYMKHNLVKVSKGESYIYQKFPSGRKEEKPVLPKVYGEVIGNKQYVKMFRFFIDNVNRIIHFFTHTTGLIHIKFRIKKRKPNKYCYFFFKKML